VPSKSAITTVKKAAKKAAKKAPAKHAAKHAAKKSAAHHTGKDTRRAYEHFGRVQALAVTTSHHEDAQVLIDHAQRALAASQPKDAAELLRAAEHILFGTLQESAPADTSISPELLAAIREDYEHMLQKAEDHGSCADAPRAVLSIFRSLQKRASAAIKSNRYRAALELARGAEALTHADFPRLLAAGKSAPALR
jgi:hypothetical protein